MEINRAAFGALAVFGVVAAGGGAYLANRHNEVAMQPVTTYPAATTSAVTETENTIATAPAAAVETAPVVAADPAPAPPRPARVARPAPVRTAPPASQRARVVVEFQRQRVFSGADVYAVGHARRSHPCRRRSSRWKTRPSNARPSPRNLRGSCTTSS